MLELSLLFPSMPKEFWGIAGKKTLQKGFSQQRLQYIIDFLAENHHYPTLTLADILSVDKVCKIYSYDEFYKTLGTTEVKGYCILKQRGADGHIRFANTNQAKLLNLQIEREF